jgi:hypothetical protein
LVRNYAEECLKGEVPEPRRGGANETEANANFEAFAAALFRRSIQGNEAASGTYVLLY